MLRLRVLFGLLFLAWAWRSGFAQLPHGVLEVKELPKNRYLVTLHNNTGDTLRMLSPYWQHTTATQRRFYWKQFAVCDFNCDRKGFRLYRETRSCFGIDSLIFSAEYDSVADRRRYISSCRPDDTTAFVYGFSGVSEMYLHITPHSSATFRFRSLNARSVDYFRITTRSTRTGEEFIFESARPFTARAAGPPQSAPRPRSPRRKSPR